MVCYVMRYGMKRRYDIDGEIDHFNKFSYCFWQLLAMTAFRIYGTAHRIAAVWTVVCWII